MVSSLVIIKDLQASLSVYYETAAIYILTFYNLNDSKFIPLNRSYQSFLFAMHAGIVLGNIT